MYIAAELTRGLALSAVLLATTALPGAAHASEISKDMKRSEKQAAKRQTAITKLKPKEVAARIIVTDDPMESVIRVTTDKVFTWRGGFTDPVRSDNFVRGFMFRNSGTTSYQLYQTITYTIDWRRFDNVNVMFPSGLRMIKLDVLSRDVDCQYGCVYTETVAFNLSEEDMAELEAAYQNDKAAVLKFRLKAQNGLDWDDDVPLIEIVAAHDLMRRLQVERAKNAP